MKFQQSLFSALLTITAIAGTQSSALAQPFKVPTHPTLSEVGVQTPSPTTPTILLATPMPKSQPLAMIQVSGSQSYFSHPPTLLRSHAAHNLVHTPSTYEFTISVPADAGSPLKAVTINQDKNLETVKFNAQNHKAFAGNRYAAGSEIPLVRMGGAEVPGMTMVVFQQPVQPGSTVTIALDAKANPSWGGVYEFGVTAYPISENGRGQFLGYGRINFHGTGD